MSCCICCFCILFTHLFLIFKERVNSAYKNVFMYDASLYLNRSIVPTSNIVYGPSLVSNNFCRRTGFRNRLQSPTLYLFFILFRFSLLLDLTILFYLNSIPVCLKPNITNHISSKY
jgi:hypothetical protein